MGSYLPVIQLIPPEQKQLITLNSFYKFGRNTNIYAEIGLSNLDKNRRSAINNDDNTGLSFHVAIDHSMKLDSAANWTLRGILKHEFVHKNFNALNPYRPPEFVRDWNLELISSKADENLLLSNIGISGKSGFSGDYGYNRFDKGNIYNGAKHEATFKYQGERIQFRAFTNLLTSKSSIIDQNTTFLRPNVTLSYKLDKKITGPQV